MGLTDTDWLKAAKTTSLRRRIHCDVICHTTARRRSWQLSPDSEIGPIDPTLPGHSWGQYLVGTIPRSIRICVPILVMIGPAVWPPILDRQTHTQNLYYIDTSWIPGFARDTLSRSLSPSLSRPSLPSLLFVPAFYPPSLGLPGFAQDNCIPEIPFKPWSLVTLKFSPLTPPPVGWGGVGVTCFGYFFGRIFFVYRFSRQFVKFPALLKFWPPQPPRESGPPGVGWVNICFIDFLDIHGSHWHWLSEGSENDVITSTDSLWRHLPHNGSQKKLVPIRRLAPVTPRFQAINGANIW